MIEWAEYEFRRSRSAADGATAGDHQDSAARQLANLPGRRPKPVVEIVPDEPPFPDELQYLFLWFIDICSGLTANGFGPALVTWESLTSWQTLMDIGPLEPWEVKTLVNLGMIRAKVYSEQQEDERKERQRRNM